MGGRPTEDPVAATTVAGLGALTAPYLARLVVVAVCGGFCLIAFLFVLAAGTGVPLAALSLVLLAAIMLLEVVYFSQPRTDLRSRRAYLMLAAHTCLVVLPLPVFGQSWMGMPSLLIGNALLVMPAAARWLAFPVLVAATGWIQALISGSSVEILDIVVGTMLASLSIYGLTRLAALVVELHQARAELARIAVARQRLRFARDLRDRLGSSLTAIVPRIELAMRHLPTAPERAQREMPAILEIARRALVGTRSFVTAYRDSTLEEESRAIRSLLAAANVDVRMDVNHGELPPPIRMALATALREGVANVLRHSGPGRCEVVLRQTRATVSLDIVNDAAPGTPARPGDDAFARLADTVAALGGRLSAGVESDGRFRLHVWLPIPDEQHGVRRKSDSDEYSSHVTSRFARLFLVAMCCGLALQYEINLGYRPWTPGTLAATSALMLALVVLQVGYFGRPRTQLRSPTSYAVLAVQAVLVLAPLPFTPMTGNGVGFLCGSLLLVARPTVSWPAFAVTMALIGWIYSRLEPAFDLTYQLLSALLGGLVVYGATWMVRVVAELRVARIQLADAAVAEERLRFARDLHDLLGLSLSAIALKGELAARLVTVDPVRARDELGETLTVALRALADVRSVAAGHQHLSLRDESSSAETLLAAAGFDVRVRLADIELPIAVGTVLATVLREGTTNVLRHSKGQYCEINVRRHDANVVLDMVNDGVDATAPTGRGSGIHNLSDRVAGIGGELRAGIERDRRFRLRATVPLQPEPIRGG